MLDDAIFAVKGSYVQWRAKAIGEKSGAAETKLNQAGPYVGMTTREAMSVVLRVLRDVLNDEFSVDRLEMVCIDSCVAGGKQETGLRTREDDVKPMHAGPEGALLEDDPTLLQGRASGIMEGSRGASRNSWFRRVTKSEMEELLNEE